MEAQSQPRQLPLVRAGAPDRDQFALLSIALDVQGGGPPSEFRLFAAGENRTTKGPFLFDAISCSRVALSAAEWGVDHVIDYAHASLNQGAVDPAESGKAAGWFTPEIRNGELWATKVTWTPAAAAKLAAREYRYISPAADFETAKDGCRRITALTNCALTNLPATIGAPPLVASRQETFSMASSWVPMCFGQWCSAASVCCQACPVKQGCCSIARCQCPPDPSGGVDVAGMQMSAREGFLAHVKESRMKTVLARLGLTDTASEAEALVALQKTQEEVTALLSVTGKTTPAEAVGVIQGWKAAADQVAVLSAKIADAEKAQAAREIDQLIDEAQKDGRLPPAAEKAAREVALSGVASLKAMLSVLPKVGGGEGKREPAAGDDGAVVLTAEEKRQAKLARIPEEQMLKTKQAMLAQRAAAKEN